MPGAGREPRARLVAAVLLLCLLVLAACLTSTPKRSAASTWATWAWRFQYRVLRSGDATDPAGIHAGARLASRDQCVACHGDKTDSELPVHRIHLLSDLLKNIACHDCHQRVDLGSRSSTVAPTLVDVGFCKSCHSAFPGAAPGSHMDAGDFEADCTMCHTGERRWKHAQPYLPQIVKTSECRGCHGGRELPWTPRHERSDWLRTHGAEALGTGTDRCFACHDFGLRFCDDCHAKRPPSHSPSEQWLALHPESARADTRRCYTCHETSFCKKCHVDHEAGWMETHPAFVKEKGDASCTECHSLSSCAYCHTAHAQDAASGR